MVLLVLLVLLVVPGETKGEDHGYIALLYPTTLLLG